MNHEGFNTKLQANEIVALDVGYYFAFFVYCLFHLLESTNYQTILGLRIESVSKIAIALVLVLLILRMLLQKYSYKALLLAEILFAVGVVVFFITGSWIPLSIVLFVYAGRGLSVDMLMRILLATSLFVLLITVGGMHLGYIKTLVTFRYGESLARNSLGFFQANAVGLIVARICTSIVVLRWDKSRPLISIVLMLVLVVFVDSTANSRTAEVYILVLAVVFASHSVRKIRMQTNNSRALIVTLLTLILSSSFLSWGLLMFFSPSSQPLMDVSRLFSHRIYSAWHFFQSYGITMFGNGSLDISFDTGIWVGNSYAALTIDNAWDLWLLRYGLIPSLLLLVGLVGLYKRAYAERVYDGKLVVFAIICSIYAFSESSAFSFDFNPLFLLISNVLFDDTMLPIRSANKSTQIVKTTEGARAI